MIFRGSFLVVGTPRMPGSNARSRTAWRQRVAAIASVEFDTAMNIPKQIKADITFYFDEIPDFDLDNMCKLILDSMKGIVYEDDNQVADLNPRRRRKRGSYRVNNPPEGFSDALINRDSFIVVEIYEMEEDEL